MAVVKKTKQAEPKGEDTLSTLFGQVKVSIPHIETERKFNVFDFVNDINFNKQYLYADDTASEYDPYTINRAMTIFPDTFVAGEFLNLNYHLDKKMQHDYLYHSVQKRKRWKKDGWLKRTEQEKKEIKILKEVGKLINYNMKATKQFWSILTTDQKKEFLETYIYPDSKNSKK